MLITNKVAVHTLPAPSLVLFVQLMSAALAVHVVGLLGITDVDSLEYQKVRYYQESSWSSSSRHDRNHLRSPSCTQVKGFAPVALAFLGVIFANIKTLQYANVETFIVFRASTPIVVSVADFVFLGRALPSCRSWLALLGLCFGVAGYVLTDTSRQFDGYWWIAAWYVLFCFDQIYIKHAVETVAMRSNWGRVFYCNLLAALPLAPWAYDDFFHALEPDAWNAESLAVLAVSSLLGCGISYFAFACRKALSATAFTVSIA